MMWLLFSSCLVRSDQEFAVLNQGVESVCDRLPQAQNCQPEEEEEFEPIPNDDDPEDFLPEVRIVRPPLFIVICLYFPI